MRFSTLISQTIALYRPILERNFLAESRFGFYVRPYLGKAGPKRFTGTPDEVVRKFREWQREKP